MQGEKILPGHSEVFQEEWKNQDEPLKLQCRNDQGEANKNIVYVYH